MPSSAQGALLLTILIGTPILSLIGAIGVALTVGLKKGGVLLSLLILPLYIPVLIFATSAIDAASMNLPFNGQLAIMAAIFFGSFLMAIYFITELIDNVLLCMGKEQIFITLSLKDD